MAAFPLLVFQVPCILSILSGFDSGSGGSRRAFGTGFRRDYDDNRGSGDRYGDKDRYGSRDDKYEKREERQDDRGESSVFVFALAL